MCNRDTCIEYQLVDPVLQEAMTLQEVSCGESKHELSIQKTINETIRINKIIIYNIIVIYFKACICPDVCVFDLMWVLVQYIVFSCAIKGVSTLPYSHWVSYYT